MMNPKSDQAYDLLHQGALALCRAEQQGIRVDIPYVENKIIHLKRKIERIDIKFKETEFYKEWEKYAKGKVNIQSHAQLGKFLYQGLGYDPPKVTKSGKGSTDEESLLLLNITELNELLQKSKLKKLIDVLEGFYKEQVNGVLHTNFNLHMVISYRSSSSDPNMQNVPKRDEDAMYICRKALYPRKGHLLLEIDFKGIEVAINACYNKDTNLIKYVSDPTTDMHRDMAIQIFKLDDFDKSLPEHQVLRQASKNGFVFPQFYGDYYKNCAENLASNWGYLTQRKWKPGEGIKMHEGFLSDHLINKGIKSFLAFTEHIKKIEDDFWGNRFQEYAEWKELWWGSYKKYGYIDLLTGFRCQGLMDMKQACNYPGQGTAFHCLLWSLIQTDKEMKEEKLTSRIIGQVHDSMTLDVHPSELTQVVKLVQDITTIKLREHWPWIIVPMSIDMEICDVDEPLSNKRKYVV